MQTAIAISNHLGRQIWVVISPLGVTRLHLFYRPTMGKLIALVIGSEIINYQSED